jgi:hypothetical protein
MDNRCQKCIEIDQTHRWIPEQIGATKRFAMDGCLDVGCLHHAATGRIVGLHMNGFSDKITKPPAAAVVI